MHSIYILLVKAIKKQNCHSKFFINLNKSVITYINSFAKGYIIYYKYANN